MTTVKKPHDHQAKTEDRVYTHEFPDGRSITVPTMDRVPFGVIRKIRNESEMNQAFGIVEAMCPREDLAVLDEQEQAAALEFLAGWQEESGLGVGESSASED